jgi:hypothetical protein
MVFHPSPYSVKGTRGKGGRVSSSLWRVAGLTSAIYYTCTLTPDLCYLLYLYLDPDPVEVCPNERTDNEDGDLEGPEYEAKVPDLQTLLHSLARIERGLQSKMSGKVLVRVSISLLLCAITLDPYNFVLPYLAINFVLVHVLLFFKK